jgi:hypothetical protein
MRVPILILGLLTGLSFSLSCLAGAPAKLGDKPQAGSSSTVFTDPVPYCKAVGTIDPPDGRYQGPAVADWMASALYTPQEIAAQKAAGIDVARSIVWRCTRGSVFGCVQPNNLICGKANTDREPTNAMRDFCTAQPNASVIPLSVIGHENPMIFEWACHGKQPTITRQVFKVDAQGFPSDLWKQISPAHK